MKINKQNDMLTKNKCFAKKKYVSLSSLSLAIDDVDENEKNKPNKKRSITENRISLFIFLIHLANFPVFSLEISNIF